MKWYKYDIRNLNDSEYAKWFSLTSEEKRQRVTRLRFQDDRKRTVAGEMLARQAIAKWCNVSEESIEFGKRNTGKPFAKGLPVEFNISHSGNMVVCAVDEQPVGIDIEQIRPLDLRIAKRICTLEELLYLFGHMPDIEDFKETPDYETLTRFFELWTAKEAYSKCLGTGIVTLRSQQNTAHCRDIIYFDEYIISIVRPPYTYSHCDHPVIKVVLH